MKECMQSKSTSRRWTKSCGCIQSQAQLRTASSIFRKKRHGSENIYTNWRHFPWEKTTIKLIQHLKPWTGSKATTQQQFTGYLTTGIKSRNGSRLLSKPRPCRNQCHVQAATE